MLFPAGKKIPAGHFTDYGSSTARKALWNRRLSVKLMNSSMTELDEAARE